MHPCETLKFAMMRSLSVAALLGLLTASVSRGEPFPPDPVEELRQALKMTRGDLLRRNPALVEQLAKLKPEDADAALQKERGRVLAEKVDALRSLSDLRRALVLREWRQEFEPSAPDPKYRAQVAERFQNEVRRVLRGKDDPAKLAVMAMLAETAVSTATPEERQGRTFGKDLADLALDAPNSRIRQAAARTLGLVFPDPRVAAPALGQLLSSKDVKERRSAAAALGNLVKVIYQLTTSGKTANKVEATTGDFVDAGKIVLPLAGRGLLDSDLEVRRQSALSLAQTAEGMLAQVPQRATTEEDILNNPAFVNVVRSLLPLLDTLGEQTGVMSKSINDPDPEIRIRVRRALEELITARLRAQRFTSIAPRLPLPALPPDSNFQGEISRPNGLIKLASQRRNPEAPDQVEEKIRAAVPALALGLSDPDFESRLAALDALEVMGPTAAPAVPALLGALSDPNQFIRWAAVRTVGKIGYVDNPNIVPALVKLLNDPDLDVRLASCLALANYGPAAGAAVEGLIRAIQDAGDTELQVSAMNTLESIGTASKPAIPALIEALGNPDARARQKAAEVLAKFGPSAVSAIPALRKALDDENGEVRRASSEALLRILQAGEKK